MTMNPAQYIRNKALTLICLMAVMSACGPTREESWNSYYYGTSGGDSYYDHGQDNDDTYEMPWGTWKDDQTPQGQKW